MSSVERLESIIEGLTVQNLALRRELKSSVALPVGVSKHLLGSWVGYVDGSSVLAGRVVNVTIGNKDYVYHVKLQSGSIVQVSDTELVGCEALHDVGDEVMATFPCGKQVLGSVKKVVVTVRNVDGNKTTKVAYHVRYSDNGCGSRVTVLQASSCVSV